MNATTEIQPECSTPRLHLALLRLDDADFMRELVNSEGWLRFIGDRNVHSPADAEAYVGRVTAAENLYYWVVRLRENDLPVGIISFLKREYLAHFDLGFAFLPQFQGYGYAREAAQAVLNMAKKLPQHQTILATTIPENRRSIELLEKLGFVFDQKIEPDGEPLLLYKCNG